MVGNIQAKEPKFKLDFMKFSASHDSRVHRYFQFILHRISGTTFPVATVKSYSFVMACDCERWLAQLQQWHDSFQPYGMPDCFLVYHLCLVEMDFL